MAPTKVIVKGIKTALVVGTLLTIINQWSALFGSENVRWPAFFLTYLVPFSVFIYSYRSTQASPAAGLNQTDKREDPASK